MRDRGRSCQYFWLRSSSTSSFNISGVYFLYMSTQNAFARWTEIIDKERVLFENEAMEKYGADTTSVVRVISGALRPITQEEVQKILAIANEEKISVYPISTGHNWGYGTAMPVRGGNVILDLSLMNKIIDFNKDLGVVTLQPGVTQKILYDYLEEHNLEFIVPTTGAGPQGSILGNALERGFGPTQFTDHLSAIMSVSAVLADGSMYNSPLEEYGCGTVDKLYRYAVGPYLGALFSQSNFGVVTSATFALTRKPDVTSMFFIKLNSDQELRHFTNELPTLLGKLGLLHSGFKFVNKYQLAALSNAGQKRKLKLNNFPEWLVTGSLAGDRRLVGAAKKVMKSHLKSVVHSMYFLDANFFVKHIPKVLMFPIPQIFKKAIINFTSTLEIFLGKPTEAALAVAYLRSGTVPENKKELDPGKDGCGIIWFAPLIPIEGDLVLAHSKLVERIFTKYKFPRLLTFTTLNDRCFDSPVPILFDKNNEESVKDAKMCYDELWNESRKTGFSPYRIPIDEQHRITESGTPFWDTVKKIKDALDPNGIISPGRYSKS